MHQSQDSEPTINRGLAIGLAIALCGMTGLAISLIGIKSFALAIVYATLGLGLPLILMFVKLFSS